MYNKKYIFYIDRSLLKMCIHIDIIINCLQHPFKFIVILVNTTV